MRSEAGERGGVLEDAGAVKGLGLDSGTDAAVSIIFAASDAESSEGGGVTVARPKASENTLRSENGIGYTCRERPVDI